MLNTFIFLLHILPNVIGLLLNAVLFFIARYRSPHAIKKYSILILNFAICDFFACLTSLFVCQRIIPHGSSLFYLSEGPCQYFGSRTCYISYSIMLHLYAHTLYSILLSFSFRYYVLNYRPPSRIMLKFIILLIYSPSFIQMTLYDRSRNVKSIGIEHYYTYLSMISFSVLVFTAAIKHSFQTCSILVLFSFADDPPEMVEPLLREKYPHYNMTGRTISGNLNVLEWKALFTILHMTLPITPVYICILVLRRGIVRHLTVAVMSTKTKLLHQQLLKALSWQACLPFFYLYAVLSYACGQLGIYHHPYIEHSTFISVGFIPALSPISSLYFVRPYREYIRHILVKKEKRPHYKETSTLPESHSSKYFSL